MSKDGSGQEKPPTKSGRVLENYKQWYYKQPKAFRAVSLPLIFGLSALAIEVNDAKTNWWYLLAILLLLNIYNQYLETLLGESLADEKRISRGWQNYAERLLNLNNVLKELVENKSRMFVEALITAKDSGVKEAIKQIRKEGSFDKNLSRIVAMLYKVFEKYADTHKDQRFRVTYLAPEDHSDRLVAKAWYNIDQAPPVSIETPNGSYFSKGDKTVAGYLWGREDQESILIDDVGKHIAKEGTNALFTYTHQGQSGYLKSVLCYKVTDHMIHECLGILCIDTNIPGTLGANETYFKTVLESFAKRIVFEARCAYMKTVLNTEEKE